MARDNQGLQIALIIFVMLAVILGATTWYFLPEIDRNRNQVQNRGGRKAKKRRRKWARFRKKPRSLRSSLPVRRLRPSSMKSQKYFAKDMQDYGSGYPAESQFYAPLVEEDVGRA